MSKHKYNFELEAPDEGHIQPQRIGKPLEMSYIFISRNEHTPLLLYNRYHRDEAKLLKRKPFRIKLKQKVIINLKNIPTLNY